MVALFAASKIQVQLLLTFLTSGQKPENILQSFYSITLKR